MGQVLLGELEWIVESHKSKKKKECKHPTKYATPPGFEGVYLIKCLECNKLIYVYLPKS